MQKASFKNLNFDKSRHGRQRIYYRRRKGARIRLPDDMNTPEFLRAYEAAKMSIPITDVRHMKPTPMETRKQKTEAVLRKSVIRARTRAARKNVPFDLTLDFLLDMAAAQDFRCALTGIEFFAPHSVTARVNPYTPSIDRITPALGYTAGNVRLVIFAVNAMLLDWGEEFFIRIANSHRYWGRTKNRQVDPLPSRAKPRTSKKD